MALDRDTALENASAEIDKLLVRISDTMAVLEVLIGESDTEEQRGTLQTAMDALDSAYDEAGNAIDAITEVQSRNL